MRKSAVGAAVFTILATMPDARAELIYGVTPQQFLVSWDSSDPLTILSGIAIQGLLPNEALVGIDIRPATGQLYALGSFSRLYTLDPATGMTSQVGGPGSFSPLLNGGSFGMDFNPVVDRIRVVSNADQNFRLDPNTGVVAATDSALAYAAIDPNFGVNPNVVHAAYTNNFAGAPSTLLYGIDVGLDVLVTQNPPNAGVLNTVGGLGLDATDIGGFDISGATGSAYAVLFTGAGGSRFATIDLATGAATVLGEIDGGTVITALTVVPEPGTLLLLGFGAAAALWRIRSRRR